MTGRNLGLLIGTLGFATFTVGDTVTKSLSGDWSPLSVGALRFIIGAAVLGLILAWREGPRAFIPKSPWIQMGRGFCLAFATVGFFSGVFIMPLATAISITFVAPAITALLSYPLLGERVRPLTWVAIVVAFTGVLVVLQPNVISLGWAALLPLLNALGMSFLVIANRKVASEGSALSMQFFVAIWTAPFLLVAAIIGGFTGIEMLELSWPDWSIFARCIFIALTGTIAHSLVYLGTTKAGAATISPTAYIQIITASILGWLVFGDAPEWATLAGSAIIIGAGLLLWWDGRILASTQQRR